MFTKKKKLGLTKITNLTMVSFTPPFSPPQIPSAPSPQEKPVKYVTRRAGNPEHQSTVGWRLARDIK
jgi:hypothetical protein